MVRLSNIPLAIFAYNRPESLKRLLDSLQNCDGYDQADVTIFIDGPRSDADLDAVRKTRQVAETLAKPNWVIKADAANKGLRRSISQGVTDVCNRHGRAIVIEDDLVLSPLALRYFQDALDRYADEPRVWSICGYMFQSKKLMQQDSNFFLPYAHPWGWATWSRAWSKFQLDSAPLDDRTLNATSFRTMFDAYGISSMVRMLKLAQKGLVNSWYVQWHRKIVTEGGVCLFPPTSYIENAGIGRGGTHGSALNPYNLLVTEQKIVANRKFSMPDEISIDFASIDKIKKTQEIRAHKIISFLGSIKRQLKK